jgi:hypothetical protein
MADVIDGEVEEGDSGGWIGEEAVVDAASTAVGGCGGATAVVDAVVSDGVAVLVEVDRRDSDKESDLRVNGSFHGCVNSRFVARWIFVSFSSYFRRFFVCGLFLRF